MFPFPCEKRGSEAVVGKDSSGDVKAAARQQETHHLRGRVEQKRKVSGENSVQVIIGEFRNPCQSTHEHETCCFSRTER